MSETAARPLRFPVQYVLRAEGSGAGFARSRGYMGRIASGTLRVGDEVVALPSGRRTRVEAIMVLEGVRDAAAAGDSVTLLLADQLDVSRGDMLVDPVRQPHAAKAFEARLCWLANEPLALQGHYLLRHTSGGAPEARRFHAVWPGP